MEIFLLLVLILLVVIFNSAKGSKVDRIEQKLQNIEKYLNGIQFNQTQQTVVQKSETKAEPIKETSVPVVPNAAPEVIITIPDIQQPIIKEVVEEEAAIKITEAKSNTTIINEVENKNTTINEQILRPVQKPIHKPIPKQSWYDTFRKNNPDLEKFIGENIVSKIGVAILVIGIAFFVKFAIDQNWIKPIGRVAIGVLCGLIVLGFAHRLRKNFQAFSSVLVAGGIAVFYFTIGIAFHQYHIFGQTAAFIIMLLITSFSKRVIPTLFGSRLVNWFLNRSMYLLINSSVFIFNLINYSCVRFSLCYFYSSFFFNNFCNNWFLYVWYSNDNIRNNSRVRRNRNNNFFQRFRF